MTDADLLVALRDCYVPHRAAVPAGRNIVDLGLVQSVSLVPDAQAPGAGIPGVPQRLVAYITVRAPGSDEDVNAQLGAVIRNRLAGLPAISSSQLTLLPALFPILAAG